jgi:hypothetical protein
MNKEKILECFYSERKPIPGIEEYFELYDVYLTSEVLAPANFEISKTTKPVVRNLPRDNFSVSNTLSICSAFSRISIDRSVYIDIVGNRKKHDVFLTLEEEDKDAKKWHYIDDKEIIRGPFSSLQMNDFFIFNKINDKIQIKESYVNDDFIPFKQIIKRYYRKITAEMEEAKRRKPDLKNRTREFKIGEYINTKTKKRESMNYHGRMDRVLTHEVRPSNLYFLEEAIEDPDLAELLEGRRDRAGTSA